MDTSSIIIALGSAAIGAIVSVGTTLYIQHRETKRKLQSELIKIGFEHWKKSVELYKSGESTEIPFPPIAFILALTNLSKTIDGLSDLSEAELSQLISQYYRDIQRIADTCEICNTTSQVTHITSGPRARVKPW